jgi:predicted XRE-type DNA-binding protein
MNKDKQRALEAAGFVFGDAEDFLELTPEEQDLVELRIAVSRAVRARRVQQRLTQAETAKKLKTSQPRVAKIEAGASDVSLDLMFRGLFILGGTMKDVRTATHARRNLPRPTSPKIHRMIVPKRTKSKSK